MAEIEGAEGGSRPRRRRSGRSGGRGTPGAAAIALAVAASVAWLAVAGRFAVEGGLGGLSMAAPGAELAVPALLLLLPVALFWTVAAVALIAARMRAETSALRGELRRLRAAAPHERAEAPRETPPAAPAVPAAPAAPAPEGLAPAEVARALDLPRGARDGAGFALLRRALEDPDLAQLIAAAQEALTLLAQDGIYMDDLSVRHASPGTWRALAADRATRAQYVALAGIADAADLAAVSARLSEDPAFRAAVERFLDRYLGWLGPFCRAASDIEIAAHADSRTGRAFMLLGTAAGLLGAPETPGA
jgi:hypothetical protein